MHNQPTGIDRRAFEESEGLSASQASRRGFLLLSLLAMAGCASSGSTGGDVASLPMAWPDAPPPPPKKPVVTVPERAIVQKPPVAESCPMPGIMPRAKWARGFPDYSQMDRMLPIKYITVHHDGMDPFDRTSERDCAARIELIRNSHTGGRHFGDIGYHYIIDRAGRVWEGRPLTYQGAHVKNRNEGNIGVLCMGNFDRQVPSDPQFIALCRHVGTLMKKHNVPTRNVYTHQKWPGAKTACPGRNLNDRFWSVRNRGQLV